MDRTFYEDVLILMRKGILRFSENGVPVELRPGEYYIQRAGLLQQGTLPCEIPNYFFIHFHGSFVENGKLPIRGTFSNEMIRPTVQAIELLGNAAPKLEYERLFYTLLSDLSKQQLDESLAETIRTYLIQNHKRDVSLGEIEDKLFLTKNQIIYIFRSAYGKTPHRYLMDYRLDKASEYLVSSNRSVASIAYDVGFQEYSVFYRAFVAKFGVSPSDYREIKVSSFFIPPPNERPNK